MLQIVAPLMMTLEGSFAIVTFYNTGHWCITGSLQKLVSTKIFFSVIQSPLIENTEKKDFGKKNHFLILFR
jgi:hypothetical protein